MEDRKDSHLVEVWLHELQDHANLIANLPSIDQLADARNSYYEGFGMGLNSNTDWQTNKFLVWGCDKPRPTVGHMFMLSAGLVGFDNGQKFIKFLEREERPQVRQKAYDKLKAEMTKITPWSDQTRKPL